MDRGSLSRLHLLCRAVVYRDPLHISARTVRADFVRHRANETRGRVDRVRSCVRSGLSDKKFTGRLPASCGDRPILLVKKAQSRHSHSCRWASLCRSGSGRQGIIAFTDDSLCSLPRAATRLGGRTGSAQLEAANAPCPPPRSRRCLRTCRKWNATNCIGVSGYRRFGSVRRDSKSD